MLDDVIFRFHTRAESFFEVVYLPNSCLLLGLVLLLLCCVWRSISFPQTSPTFQVTQVVGKAHNIRFEPL